jgi:predicted dehydrogenase
MKLAILGTGKIVMDLMNTYDSLPIEKTVLLATKHSVEKAKNLASEHKFDQIYYDYDELLASDIDTVYVALPNHLHYSFAKKALEANKHVIIEKPVTANAKELADLIHIAKERHLMIIEAVTVHYLPAYLNLKEHLSDLGNIRIISMNYSQYSSRYDAFKEGNILPAFDYHKAGGALYDLNVYNLNFIIGLFGKPKSVTYQANVSCGIDTSGIAALDYGDFKAVCIGAKDCKAPVMSTIEGDEGFMAINTPVNGMQVYHEEDNKGVGRDFASDAKTHRMYYEFMEFIRMIDEKDYDMMHKMLKISQDVSLTMEMARKNAGIIFDNDKEHS